MDTTSGATPLYRFAGFVFHAGTGELRQAGKVHVLPEQACRVLLTLLKAGGELVSREELRTTLWPGRSFGDFEGGLNTAICKLRQVLEDDGAEPHIIGTLPRRGYRMLVPVEKEELTGKGGIRHGEPVRPDGERWQGAGMPARPPGQDPIWVMVDAQGVEGSSDREKPTQAPAPGVRSRNLRRIRIGLSAALAALGIGGAWLLADPDLRRVSILRIRRVFVPIQILRGRIIRNPIGMEFVRIPAGSFTMGTDALPVEWGDMNFRPAHRVTLSHPFLLQTTEVTVGQFKAFVAATNYRTDGEKTDGIRVSKGLQPASASQGHLWDRTMKRVDATWKNPYFVQEDDCPVVGVSWNDTQAFIDWLNEKDPGKGYRLPTEAEWEYACRAGTPGEQPTRAIGEIAWIGENSAFRSHPVGRRWPNVYGLHDMLGNAWEWCQDWYRYGYSTEQNQDPTGPTWGTLKVIRGGGWRNSNSSDRVLPITRYYAGVREGSDDIGFRLAASADSP